MRHALIFLALGCSLLPSLLAAQIAQSGPLPHGGHYQIQTPAGWQSGGPLVVYNHGFSADPVDDNTEPSLAPSDELRDYFLQRGFALAAGSYSQRGWAVFNLRQDQRALLDVFKAEAGEPGSIFLVGGSLGGLVSLKTAEFWAEDGEPVAGTLALCPPLAGARTWDGAADLKLAYDSICDGSGDIDPGSNEPFWAFDYDRLPEGDWLGFSLGNDAVVDVAEDIVECTGIELPDFLVSDGQEQRYARLREQFQFTDDDAFLLNMAYAVFATSDLVFGPDKLAGGNFHDNRFVEYGDAEVDADIERVERDPLAAVELRGYSDVTGAVGDSRVLVIHTSRDELVRTQHMSVLPELGIPSEQLASAIVTEDAVGHCQFDGLEVVAGFESLVAWADGAPAPDAESLLAVCEMLGGELGVEGECRFDPAAGVAPFESIVAERGVPQQPVDAATTGSWYDPSTSGEGLFIEVQPGNERAIVSWYTYPDAGGEGEQSWIIGNGVVTEDGILVDQAMRYRGPAFGETFDADALVGEPWGSLIFWQDVCNPDDPTQHGRLRYRGPEDVGDGERELVQLSFNGRTPSRCRPIGTPPPPSPFTDFTGSWYRGPAASGDGVMFQAWDDRAIAIWYTFDPEGNPAWLLAVNPVFEDEDTLVFDVLRPVGTFFGDAFDRDAVDETAWGELRLEFDGCLAAELSWTTDEPGWGPGSIELQRLSIPAGASCEPRTGG